LGINGLNKFSNGTPPTQLNWTS